MVAAAVAAVVAAAVMAAVCRSRRRWSPPTLPWTCCSAAARAGRQSSPAAAAAPESAPRTPRTGGSYRCAVGQRGRAEAAVLVEVKVRGGGLHAHEEAAAATNRSCCCWWPATIRASRSAAARPPRRGRARETRWWRPPCRRESRARREGGVAQVHHLHEALLDHRLRAGRTVAQQPKLAPEVEQAGVRLRHDLPAVDHERQVDQRMPASAGLASVSHAERSRWGPLHSRPDAEGTCAPRTPRPRGCTLPRGGRQGPVCPSGPPQ
jgi:hypothetical protein